MIDDIPEFAQLTFPGPRENDANRMSGSQASQETPLTPLEQLQAQLNGINEKLEPAVEAFRANNLRKVVHEATLSSDMSQLGDGLRILQEQKRETLKAIHKITDPADLSIKGIAKAILSRFKSQ